MHHSFSITELANAYAVFGSKTLLGIILSAFDMIDLLLLNTGAGRHLNDEILE